MVRASTLAKICTSLFSVICLVGGLILLSVASGEAHEKKALEFQTAVDAWPTHRFQFEHLDVSGSVNSSAFKSSTAAKLSHSEVDDAKKFQNSEDLSRFEPLSYRLGATPSGFLPVTKFQEIEWQETGRPANEHGGVWLTLNLTVSTPVGGVSLVMEPIPFVRATSRKVQQGLYNQCRLRKGTYSNGECWHYSKISRICVQIIRTESQWHFAREVSTLNTSYGCEYDQGNWSAAVYKDLDLVPANPTPQASEEQESTGTPILQTITFHDVEIIVRSAHDPFLKALEITEGTLDFGMTSEEERWLAIVLIVMSAMLCVPPACALGLYWRKQRRQRVPKRSSVMRKSAARSTPEMVGMKYAVGPDDEEVYDVR